jgi:2,4-dichlorophenol 6-monooxygenase
LCGHGKFTLLTGIGGEAWIEAAKSASKFLNIAIETVKIGPGCHYTDLYGAWAEEREIEDNGCLLVRPDFYIAWRQTASPPAAERLLLSALTNILSR